jgi:hypothetical protein
MCGKFLGLIFSGKSDSYILRGMVVQQFFSEQSMTLYPSTLAYQELQELDCNLLSYEPL